MVDAGESLIPVAGKPDGELPPQLTLNAPNRPPYFPTVSPDTTTFLRHHQPRRNRGRRQLRPALYLSRTMA